MTFYPRKRSKKKKRRILITLALLASVLIGILSVNLSPRSLFQPTVAEAPISSDIWSLFSGRDGLSALRFASSLTSGHKMTRNSAGPGETTTIITEEGVKVVQIIPSADADRDGLSFVRYVDTVSGEMFVAHCSDNFCVPIIREQ